MNELSLSLRPVAKADREALVQQVRDSILSGESNPLDAEIALKGLEDMIDLIRKSIRTYVIDEAVKFGKTFDHAGATVTIIERKTYDFSQCGDEYYNGVKAAENAAKEAAKEREKFLRTIPYEGVVLPGTGEVVNAPTFTTADIIQIKIK
jgi:hypothetical protein